MNGRRLSGKSERTMEPNQPEEAVYPGYYAIVFAGWFAGSFTLLLLGITGTGPHTIETSLAAIMFITVVTFYYGAKT